MKKKLNFWKMRDLTLYGEVLLIKSYGLSQLLYVSSVLKVPIDVIAEAEEILYDFLWGGKGFKVKKNVIIQSHENGGHKMIDLKEMLNSQKIKWVVKSFSDEKLLWKKTMKTILGVDDLPLFFKHGGQIKKCGSDFYSEMIKIWKNVLKNNVNTTNEILSQSIWYNDHIKVNKQPIFYRKLYNNGIKFISQIVNLQGDFKTFTELQNEFQLDNCFFEYLSIIESIPKEWKKVLKENRAINFTTENEFYIQLDKKDINIKHLTSKIIYEHSILQKKTRRKQI
jgi:hypothetical protein